jgi:hypothetical protein
MNNVVLLHKKSQAKKGYTLVNYQALSDLALRLPGRGKASRLIFYFLSVIQPGNLIYQNVKKIAAEMSLSVPTVRKHLDTLRREGFILQLTKSRASYWVSSTYAIKEKHMFE